MNVTCTLDSCNHFSFHGIALELRVHFHVPDCCSGCLHHQNQLKTYNEGLFDTPHFYKLMNTL